MVQSQTKYYRPGRIVENLILEGGEIVDWKRNCADAQMLAVASFIALTRFIWAASSPRPSWLWDSSVRRRSFRSFDRHSFANCFAACQILGGGSKHSLVAGMPGWVEFMIERDELDLSHSSAEPFKTKDLDKRIELLKMLDDGLIKSRKALERTTDEHLERPWRFVIGGRILFDAPRYVALNESLFCYMAHHRGQLLVYLRLNEAHVPGIYGPSAVNTNMHLVKVNIARL